jgi:histone deacetylase 6
MRVTSNGFAHMTQKLLSLANGKVVVALEGGYNEEMTATCAEAVIRVLLGDAPRDLSGPPRIKACTEDAIRKALAVQVRPTALHA